MCRASASRSARSVNSNVAGSSPNLADFETWSSQTSDIKLDTCRSLAWCLILLGYGKDWFVQCPDNGTEWDSRSQCQWPGVPIRQSSKFAMSAHCHTSVPDSLQALSHRYEAQLNTSLYLQCIVVVSSLPQLCDLYDSLHVHQATMKRNKLPTHTYRHAESPDDIPV